MTDFDGTCTRSKRRSSRGGAIALAVLAATGLVLANAPAAYDIVWVSSFTGGSGWFEGANPAQQMRASFNETGNRLASDPDPALWAVGFALTAYGHPGDLQAVGAADRSAAANRIDFNRPGALGEWYVNAENGLSGNFSIAAPPSGWESGTPLVLEFALTGDLLPLVFEREGAIDFATLEGENVLRWGITGARAADDSALAADFELVADAEGTASGLRITVNAAPEDYPVSIDTLAAHPKRHPVQPEAVHPDLSALLEEISNEPLVAPANDMCGGAQIIPAAGPFPYLTTTVDLLDATLTDDPSPSCAFNNVFSRGIWYRFTPTTTASYTFTSCHNAAPGTTHTDTVLAVFTSSTGNCGGVYTQVGCNDDDSTCTGRTLLSTVTVTLAAGTPYFVLAYSWDLGAPPPNASSVQLRVTQTAGPANDTCAGATPLLLNVAQSGTTIGAADDYRSPSTTACYAGPNQVATTAAGRDVVYSFTAPDAGAYSFRVSNYSTAQNAALYVASDCPSGTPPLTATCLAGGGANRNTANPGEEAFCLPLALGQQVFVFVDNSTASNAGSTFFIEANRCIYETEPNGTVATAQALACNLDGSIVPAGDVDFYSLGTPPAGSRVFAIADGVAGSSTDFDMRVTTATNTLEYDDADNSTPYGALAPNVSGTRLTGDPAYIRMNHFSATTQSEPYRLISVVQPPGFGLYGTSAEQEVEPNSGNLNANRTQGMYFAGVAPAGDLDVFRFCANAGDLIHVGIDGDPSRDNTPFNPAVFMWDLNLVQILGLSDAAVTSNLTPGTTLTSSTPFFPGEAATWRARYTGVHFAGTNRQGGAALADYLLSISLNCKNGFEMASDTGVVFTASPDPVVTGENLVYSFTITNYGPDISYDPTFFTTTPNGTSFVSLVQTSGPGGWYCEQLPSPGTQGNVLCLGFCLPAGQSASFELTVALDPCVVEQQSEVSNFIEVFNLYTDNDTSNNTGSATNQILDCDDGNPCTDDYCDPELGCVYTFNTVSCDDGDACTTGDTCSQGVCVGGPPPNCDDGNVCTDDSCDSEIGCVNTNNTAPCSDGNACTTNDTCGGGACIGGPPPNCDDGNVCTNDACDPAVGCVYVNNTNSCDDGNLCTTGDVCSNGTCAGVNTALNEPNPRTNGYYKRLCLGPHSGDELTNADAACVASITTTFAWVSTVADICSVIRPSQPNNDKCQQTEDDLMVLALNRCKARVCDTAGIRSQCGSNSTVGQSFAEADAILSSPSRNFTTCSQAKCVTEEVNTGRALEMNSLTLNKTAQGGTILNWQKPYMNDGGPVNQYKVWRRPIGGTGAFTRIATVNGGVTTYTDATTGNFEYEVTANGQ